MAYAPQLKRFAGWVPAVDVYFPTLPAGTHTVTIYRRTDGREWRVRGAIQKRVAGTAAVVDYEAAFGTPQTYWAECFNSAGNRIATTSTSWITLNEKDMWVHNPLDPSGAAKVQFTGDATRAISYPNLGESLQMAGESRVLFMSGIQAGIRGVDLSIATDSWNDRELVATMLGWRHKKLPPILCYRKGANHEIPIPSLLFAAVPGMVMRDRNMVWGGNVTHFTGEGDEALPPAEGITVPALTYEAVRVMYGTYGDVDDEYGTYTALNRDYQLMEWI